MVKKYKIKITKAYHIAIEDKDGYEVASDWNFCDYAQAKKDAQKLLEEVEQGEMWHTVMRCAIGNEVR